MNLTLSPTRLHGAVTPPPGKSQAHRFIIAAALAPGESVIENFIPSEDLEATLRAVETLGAEWKLSGRTLHICGISASSAPSASPPRIDCGDSGSTLRFLIPVALALTGGGIFTGSERLMERPLQPYFDLFNEKGIEYSLQDNTLTVRGTLTPGEYRLRGDVSSQFFSGLLFALPLLSSPSVLIPTARLESSTYVTLTLHALSEFGIQIPATCSLPPQYHISGDGGYQPRRVSVEADWSQAAFWYAAQCIGNSVSVSGMNDASFQGDHIITEHTERITKGGSVSIDLSGCPDLAPPLAVIGALMDGELRLKNAARLRLKESDRLTAIADTLNALGADIIVENDSLIIRGKPSLKGGVTVDCYNDHRIAMMLAIAATRCAQPVTLTGAECVGKSYPGFWKDYQTLGGIVHEHTGQ